MQARLPETPAWGSATATSSRNEKKKKTKKQTIRFASAEPIPLWKWLYYIGLDLIRQPRRPFCFLLYFYLCVIVPDPKKRRTWSVDGVLSASVSNLHPSVGLSKIWHSCWRTDGKMGFPGVSMTANLSQVPLIARHLAFMAAGIYHRFTRTSWKQEGPLLVYSIVGVRTWRTMVSLVH